MANDNKSITQKASDTLTGIKDSFFSLIGMGSANVDDTDGNQQDSVELSQIAVEELQEGSATQIEKIDPIFPDTIQPENIQQSNNDNEKQSSNASSVIENSNNSSSATVNTTQSEHSTIVQSDNTVSKDLVLTNNSSFNNDANQTHKDVLFFFDKTIHGSSYKINNGDLLEQEKSSDLFFYTKVKVNGLDLSIDMNKSIINVENNGELHFNKNHNANHNTFYFQSIDNESNSGEYINGFISNDEKGNVFSMTEKTENMEKHYYITGDCINVNITSDGNDSNLFYQVNFDEITPEQAVLSHEFSIII